MLQNENFSRKSQLYGQIFVYVLTIILISLILVYGYKSIQDFKNRAEQVACFKFKNDLQNTVESALSDYGIIKRKDIQLCNNYNMVCFVETYEIINLPNDIDPIIKDSIKSNTGRNVFLVKNIARESFYAGKISVEPEDVLCINATNNQITLRFEGFGNHVLLSEWK